MIIIWRLRMLEEWKYLRVVRSIWPHRLHKTSPGQPTARHELDILGWVEPNTLQVGGQLVLAIVVPKTSWCYK